MDVVFGLCMLYGQSVLTFCFFLTDIVNFPIVHLHKPYL